MVSTDQRIAILEKKLDRVSSARTLSDIQLYKLGTEIDSVEYVTPLGIIKTPLIDGYRIVWGKDSWLKFLQSFNNKGKRGVGAWYTSLNAKVKNYLVSGKESGNKES